MTELFPTRLRLRGVGLCNAAGRFVNVGVPYAVAAVYAFAGLLGVVSFIGVLFLVLVAVLLALAWRRGSARSRKCRRQSSPPMTWRRKPNFI